MRVWASTCLWLGSPLCVFLFRQKLCETQETQCWDCAPGCLGGSAGHRLYCRCLVLFGGGGSRVFFSFSVAYIWKERCKWQLRVPLWIRKVTKGLWLRPRRTAHSADSPATIAGRKWALGIFNKGRGICTCILLRHLARLYIHCHIKSALWPLYKPKREPPAHGWTAGWDFREVSTLLGNGWKLQGPKTGSSS